MDSTKFSIDPQSHSLDSLAITLHALIARTSPSVSVDAVCVALGLALSARLAVEEEGALRWIAVDRDYNLAPAATLFGVDLRDLHPRTAAKGLTGSPEYQGHFLDSYKPLIQRAIENGQPVLAWCGWPGDHRLSWGILTHKTDEGLGLAGVVAGCEGTVPLVAAAEQCYVVESVNPTNPAKLDILRCGIDPLTAASTDTATGADAYDRWLEQLRDTPQIANQGWQTVLQLLKANYRSGARFLSEFSATTAPLDGLGEGLRDAASALDSVTEAGQLRCALEQARESEQRIGTAISALAELPAIDRA